MPQARLYNYCRKTQKQAANILSTRLRASTAGKHAALPNHRSGVFLQKIGGHHTFALNFHFAALNKPQR